MNYLDLTKSLEVPQFFLLGWVSGLSPIFQWLFLEREAGCLAGSIWELRARCTYGFHEP